MTETDWEEMYQWASEDAEEAKATLLGVFDKGVQKELGPYYDEYKDFVIVSELVSILDDLEKPNWDVYETPDNKARDIASFYRVLWYYMRQKDYQDFVKGRRDAKTEEGD